MGILGVGILVALCIGFAKLLQFGGTVVVTTVALVGKLMRESMRQISSWLNDKPD